MTPSDMLKLSAIYAVAFATLALAWIWGGSP